jgi:hypothetical protein
VELINMAKRPVLYVGQGVIQAEATEELRQFAARANIPVTTTLQGMGAFDELDERSLCMLGMHGHVAANRAMQQADLIIAMGARFDDRVTGKLPAFAPEARRAAAAGRGGFIHFEVGRVQGPGARRLSLVLPFTFVVPFTHPQFLLTPRFTEYRSRERTWTSLCPQPSGLWATLV